MSMSSIAALEALVVNVSPKTNWSFVAVTTDAGETGWGECSLNRWEPLLVAGVQMLAPEALGSDVDAAFELVRNVPHSPGGLVMHAVKSAVEQALTDLRARRAQVPVHEAIGKARRNAIPAYANINRGVAIRSPEGFAAAARAALDAGYRNIKIAPFDGVIAQDAATTPIVARIRAGLDRVYAVRDAIGEHALMVDCHWRFDAMRATTLLRDIAGARPYWVECPISEQPAQFPAIAQLRHEAHSRGMKLAGGELVTGAEQATAMCAAGLYDVLMPDVKYAGGCRGILAIAEICEEHGVAFSPHNPSGPVAHLASIHVCAAAPSVLWLEHQWAESPLFDALVGGQVAPLIDGSFVVPRTPGLGGQPDRALAAEHPYAAVPRSANLDERLG
jgi:galactonate dehydratase